MEKEAKESASGKALSIGAVVMASGVARRFGSNKLLADLAGKPVIQHTLAALPLDAVEPVVVTRSMDVARLMIELDVPYYLNVLPYQSDTVRIGLAAGEERWDGCLFVTADQPLLTQASVRAMLDAFGQHPDRVVRLAWKGQAHNPVLFPRRLFRRLRALEGDVGGSQILRNDPDLASRTILVEAVSKAEVMDIDTPADLERIERIVEGR